MCIRIERKETLVTLLFRGQCILQWARQVNQSRIAWYSSFLGLDLENENKNQKSTRFERFHVGANVYPRRPNLFLHVGPCVTIETPRVPQHRIGMNSVQQTLECVFTFLFPARRILSTSADSKIEIGFIQEATCLMSPIKIESSSDWYSQQEVLRVGAHNVRMDTSLFRRCHFLISKLLLKYKFVASQFPF